MRVQIYITDHNGQEYRVEGTGLQTFLQYGASGSGFGNASFSVALKVGFDHHCIGYAYRIRIYKGPWKCLFDGQIVRITELAGAQNSIEIWCLGWIHTATSDVLNWVYVDNRYNAWQLSETPTGHFEPQKFCVEINDNGMYFKPRRGETTDGTFVLVDDYTYARYTFQFGEEAYRIKSTYAIALPNDYPAKVQVWCGGALLWESGVTGAGTFDLTCGGSTFFELRFISTADVDVYVEDDSVYALFSNLIVYSTEAAVFDQSIIAADAVATMADHGISESTLLLDAPVFEFPQAAFENDQTIADIMAWACGFGNADSLPVAWGIAFDDRKMLFLEDQAISEVRYTVKPEDAESIERTGDWSESAQRVYGIYNDEFGTMRRTATLTSPSIEDALGGNYRKQALNLGSAPNALVSGLLSAWLYENRKPKASGSYTVKAVQAADGRRVPFDEILPGGLVQINEWRAIETEMNQDDFRDKTTTFMLVGARVDFDNRTAELMPDEESSSYQRQIQTIEYLLNGR